MENNFDEIALQYSDEELLIMVYQFDNWDDEMLSAIQKQLLVRNILPTDITEKRNEIINKEAEALSEGKAATFSQQFLGWIGILGVLGVIIGYELAFAKTKSKFTDKEYFKYDDTSRESGRYMYYLSLAIIIGFLLYKITNYVEQY